MTTIEHNWQGHTAELLCDASVTPENRDIAALFEAIETWRKALPLSEFVAKKRTDGDFDYTFSAQDGRTWTQLLRVVTPHSESASLVRIVGTGFFTLAELAPARLVSQLVTSLIARYGMSRLEVAWA